MGDNGILNGEDVEQKLNTSDSEEKKESRNKSSSIQNDKMMFERFKLIEELIATEFIYVNDLRIITEVFMNNMQAQEIISHDEFNAIFSNINNILECNKSLYSELRQAIGTKDIENAGEKLGSVFLKFAEFLKMYQLYCQNRPNSIETQKKLMKSSKKFANFIDEILEHERVNQQPLDSFLVKPVQRICRYPLLIHGILKNTPPDHPDYKILEATLQKLQNITDVVNEYTRKKDSENRLFQLDLRISGYDGILSEAGRNLILESTIQSALSKEDTYESKLVVLTNDMILVLKPKKKKFSFKKKIVLHPNLKVEQISQQEFKLKIYDDENTLYLKFEGIADFEIWTKAIQNEILEQKSKKPPFKSPLRRKRSSSSIDIKRKKDNKLPDDLPRKPSRKSVEIKTSRSFQKLQEMINDSEKSKTKSNENTSKDDNTPVKSSISKRAHMKRSISASNIRSSLIIKKEELHSKGINNKTEASKIRRSSEKEVEKQDTPTTNNDKERRKEKRKKHIKTRSDIIKSEIREDSEEEINSSETDDHSAEDLKSKINNLTRENKVLKEELEKMKKFKEKVLTILDNMEDQIKTLRKQLGNV